MEELNSEFGMGFSYCIGLFLAHAERKGFDDLWFNGATDHLFELQIPESFPRKKEVLQWQKQCLEYRLYYPKEFNGNYKKAKEWAIDQAKTFLLEYDTCNKILAIKSDFE